MLSRNVHLKQVLSDLNIVQPIMLINNFLTKLLIKQCSSKCFAYMKHEVDVIIVEFEDHG